MQAFVIVNSNNNCADYSRNCFCPIRSPSHAETSEQTSKCRLNDICTFHTFHVDAFQLNSTSNSHWNGTESNSLLYFKLILFINRLIKCHETIFLLFHQRSILSVGCLGLNGVGSIHCDRDYRGRRWDVDSVAGWWCDQVPTHSAPLHFIPSAYVIVRITMIYAHLFQFQSIFNYVSSFSIHKYWQFSPWIYSYKNLLFPFLCIRCSGRSIERTAHRTVFFRFQFDFREKKMWKIKKKYLYWITNISITRRTNELFINFCINLPTRCYFSCSAARFGCVVCMPSQCACVWKCRAACRSIDGCLVGSHFSPENNITRIRKMSFAAKIFNYSLSMFVLTKFMIQNLKFIGSHSLFWGCGFDKNIIYLEIFNIQIWFPNFCFFIFCSLQQRFDISTRDGEWHRVESSSRSNII